MRTVYYIIGPTASGKTTSARKLAKRMGLPLFHADLAYNAVHAKLHLDCSPDALIVPIAWSKPGRFGLSSWNGYGHLDDLKAPVFEEMLSGTKGDFIIEGWTLCLRSERKLIERAVGPHRAIILNIELPFEEWREWHKAKHSQAPVPTRQMREHLVSQFEAIDSDIVYRVDHPGMIDVHYAEYQKPGFTDRKIEALKIPVQSGDVVNDIGCNEGQIGKWCAGRGASLVHGYDNNWRFLDKARENGLIVHLGNVETDPIEPADITLCVSVFHYFENPRAFLRKARAATRRLFILELPILPDEKRLYARFEPQGVNFEVMRYSSPLIEHWLKQVFSKVEHVGNSIPPDNSIRHIYHCEA